jgi:hypothetical protein
VFNPEEKPLLGATMKTNLTGLKVEIFNFAGVRGGGKASLACVGQIVRETKTQIIVMNEHGNESRYRLGDLLAVGGGDYQLSNDSTTAIYSILNNCNDAAHAAKVKRNEEVRIQAMLKAIRDSRQNKPAPAPAPVATGSVEALREVLLREIAAQHKNCEAVRKNFAERCNGTTRIGSTVDAYFSEVAQAEALMYPLGCFEEAIRNATDLKATLAQLLEEQTESLCRWTPSHSTSTISNLIVEAEHQASQALRTFLKGAARRARNVA